jgi:putative DNA primase/helicase
MLDIPVQGKFGAFDDLHGAKSASDFAHALYRNTVTHYGHAGPALVRALIEENPDLDELLARAMANFQHGDPVQGRAARMFAVVAVAGALAQHFGIVPWPATEAINAAVTLYGRWREELIASGAETPAARICQMVATYISRFGDARFSNVEGGGDDEPRVYDRAGYWEKIDDKRIYLLRSDALLDAAKGHDLREIGNAPVSGSASQGRRGRKTPGSA